MLSALVVGMDRCPASTSSSRRPSYPNTYAPSHKYPLSYHVHPYIPSNTRHASSRPTKNPSKRTKKSLHGSRHMRATRAEFRLVHPPARFPMLHVRKSAVLYLHLIRCPNLPRYTHPRSGMPQCYVALSHSRPNNTGASLNPQTQTIYHVFIACQTSRVTVYS